MRARFIASALSLAALSIVALAADLGTAQAQTLPTPPQGFKPPPPPPIKPFKSVAVTPPGPFSDPSFEAFRKTLADIAKRKDRASLAKLVVTQGFFWMQEKDLADKRKPGIENLAKAIDLDNRDGSGWEALASYAGDPTGADFPDHKGVICAPADPTFDQQAFEALLKETQSDATEWGYPIRDGTEVHGAAEASAPVVDKLGMYFVRVLPDSAMPDNPGMPPFLHVELPSAKTGFVAADALAPLGGDQMCYVKDGGGWKIAGYIGGGSP